MVNKVKLVLYAGDNIRQRINWNKAKPILDEAVDKIEKEAIIFS